MKVVNPLLERCFQLIEILAEEPRAFRLGVISERLGLQKGAVHRLLTALCSMGWVEQEPETGFYRLTLRLAIMGQRVLLATRIPDLTRPILQKLADESQELVRMAIVEGERLSWVAFVQGRRTGLIYQPEMIGRVPLAVTANGKAWLSTLPPDEATRIVQEEGFPQPGRFGPRAIRSLDAFVAALEETRARGWGGRRCAAGTSAACYRREHPMPAGTRSRSRGSASCARLFPSFANAVVRVLLRLLQQYQRY